MNFTNLTAINTNRLTTFYGWHSHAEEQVHWVISGKVEITTQENGRTNRYTLNAGDRDVIKPMVYHTLREVGGTELFYLVGIKRIIEQPKVEIVAPKPKKTRAKTTKPKTPKAKSTTKKTKTKK